MAIQPMSAEILRRAMHARKLACSNLYNLVKSTFKPDTKIMYRVFAKSSTQDIMGAVQDVYPEGYDVVIEVKAPNGKIRKIRIDQVLGLMEGIYANE